jgi:hypothetical protein
MEDASAIDLDWFWRGWFYTVDHVDIALVSVKPYRINTRNPVVENKRSREQQLEGPRDIGSIRNADAITQTYDEVDTTLRDYYSEYDPLESTILDEQEYASYLEGLTEAERSTLEADKYYYELTFELIGGLVMPLIIEFTFADGTKEVQRIPAEIWRFGTDTVSKVFPFKKEVTAIVLDPFLETADTDMSNNYYPSRSTTNRFDLYQSRSSGNSENQMQRNRRAQEQQGSQSGSQR